MRAPNLNRHIALDNANYTSHIPQYLDVALPSSLDSSLDILHLCFSSYRVFSCLHIQQKTRLGQNRHKPLHHLDQRDQQNGEGFTITLTKVEAILQNLLDRPPIRQQLVCSLSCFILCLSNQHSSAEDAKTSCEFNSSNAVISCFPTASSSFDQHDWVTFVCTYRFSPSTYEPSSHVGFSYREQQPPRLYPD